jgi:hypothetical protein
MSEPTVPVETPAEVPAATPVDDVAVLREEIAALREQVNAAPAAVPLNNVPAHAGGPGTEIAETWSLAQQEVSQAGG